MKINKKKKKDDIGYDDDDEDDDCDEPNTHINTIKIIQYLQ